MFRLYKVLNEIHRKQKKKGKGKQRINIRKIKKTCCCSVAQSCLVLWDPMDCSMTGLPVLHHLPQFVQVHVR